MQALQNQSLAELADDTSRDVGYQRQSSFLDERAALLSPSPVPPVTLKDDKGKTFAVDNEMIDIFFTNG